MTRKSTESADQVLTQKNELARAAAADQALQQEITNLICRVVDEKSCLKSSITIVRNLCREFGGELVVEWLESSAPRVNYRESRLIKYVCGIARNHRREAADAKG